MYKFAYLQSFVAIAVLCNNTVSFNVCLLFVISKQLQKYTHTTRVINIYTLLDVYRRFLNVEIAA